MCPKAKLYLFQLVEGVTRTEDVYDYILGYMKENKIELDVLIDPSFEKNQDRLQDRLDELLGEKNVNILMLPLLGKIAHGGEIVMMEVRLF